MNYSSFRFRCCCVSTTRMVCRPSRRAREDPSLARFFFVGNGKRWSSRTVANIKLPATNTTSAALDLPLEILLLILAWSENFSNQHRTRERYDLHDPFTYHFAIFVCLVRLLSGCIGNDFANATVMTPLVTQPTCAILSIDQRS